MAWRDTARGRCFSSSCSVPFLPGSCHAYSFSNACLLQRSWLLLCLLPTTQVASPAPGSSKVSGTQQPAEQVPAASSQVTSQWSECCLPVRHGSMNVSPWCSIRAALWWHLSVDGVPRHPGGWISSEFCWHGNSLTSLPSSESWRCLLQQGLDHGPGVPGCALVNFFSYAFSIRDNGCSL